MVLLKIKIRITKIRSSSEHKHTRLNLNAASRRNKVNQFSSPGTKHSFTLHSVSIVLPRKLRYQQTAVRIE